MSREVLACNSSQLAELSLPTSTNYTTACCVLLFELEMAAPASVYKDRQFLAVIGDEVRLQASLSFPSTIY